MPYETGAEESNPVVWVIGNTLLTDGLEACLRGRKMDNLVRWHAASAILRKKLNASLPKLIIFERDTPGVDHLFKMLAENPGTHFLGIDLESSQVLLMNSVQYQPRSMNDLHRFIQELAGGGGVP